MDLLFCSWIPPSYLPLSPLRKIHPADSIQGLKFCFCRHCTPVLLNQPGNG
jgi:hypothetical protein